MRFLISWLTAVYFCAASAVSCLPFFSVLRSSHGFNMSVVTHGFLTAQCLPKISVAVLVIAFLKVLISASVSASSEIELSLCGALHFYLLQT